MWYPPQFCPKCGRESTGIYDECPRSHYRTQVEETRPAGPNPLNSYEEWQEWKRLQESPQEIMKRDMTG